MPLGCYHNEFLNKYQLGIHDMANNIGKPEALEQKLGALEQKYRVIEPGEYYDGFSYERAIADWTNWLCSMDPESHNVPPVVFLTSFSYDKKGSYIMKGPSILVDDQKVLLRKGEAIFFPIIMAFAEPDDHPGVQNNAQNLYEYVERDLALSSGNLGAWIDGVSLSEDFDRFKIGSFFTLQVPAAPTERTFHNAFDIPLATPGPRSCVALGYWLFIVFNEGGTYTLQSYGRAGLSGAYESEIFCQIEVTMEEKLSPARVSKKESFKSSSNRIERLLDDMVKNKKVDEEIAKKLKPYLETVKAS